MICLLALLLLLLLLRSQKAEVKSRRIYRYKIQKILSRDVGERKQVADNSLIMNSVVFRCDCSQWIVLSTREGEKRKKESKK